MRALVLSLLLLAQPLYAVAAPETAPDVLVRKVTDEVLTIVRQDPELKAGSHRRAIQLVETKILPHFDFTAMTALALGRDWRKATPAQQSQLTAEFRTLLVRTYSNALTAYKDQKVEFKPFRMNPGDTDVVVRSQVIQPGAKPVTIDYNLEKKPEGWKVYDVVVGGVSLVTNYRSNFAQEVRSGGIEGLIRTLQAKNRSLETALLSAGRPQ
ncbi:MAG: ABC transporter substrate-binding protein [Rhodocyclaceae bacterium]